MQKKNPNNNKTLQLETKPKQNPPKQMDHPQDWFSPHVLISCYSMHIS